MGRVFTAPPVILFFLIHLYSDYYGRGDQLYQLRYCERARFVGLYNYRKMINDEFSGLPSGTRAYIRCCMCRAACSSPWERPCTKCKPEVRECLPNAVLSAGAFLHSGDRHPVVLDSESAAGPVERSSGAVRHIGGLPGSMTAGGPCWPWL